MAQLVNLTITKRTTNGRPVAVASVATGFEIDDIIGPIRYDSNISRALFTTRLNETDTRNFAQAQYEANNTLTAIKAQALFLVKATVISRRGVDMNSEVMIFNSTKMSESIIAVSGGTKFMYVEEGDANLVEYIVAESVSNIVTQTAQATSLDVVVKVSGTDTTAGYLQQKLESSDGSILFGVTNPAANEILDITVDPSFISSLAWELNGNTVTAEKWIGTVDNFEFPVRVNSLEVARFAPNRLYMANGTHIRSMNDQSYLIFSSGNNLIVGNSVGSYFSETQYNASGSYFSWTDGTDGGQVSIDDDRLLIDHTLKIVLDAAQVTLDQNKLYSSTLDLALDFGSGSNFIHLHSPTNALIGQFYAATNEAGLYTANNVLMASATASPATTNYIVSRNAKIELKHDTRIDIASPIVNFNSLSASTLVYLNASKDLVSLAAGSDGDLLTLSGGLPEWTTYVGSSSITTLGTIVSGVWNAGAVTSSGAISGTNLLASGYLQLAEQSAPATPTNAIRLYADTSNRFSWVGENGFTRTFDGTANTANRIYTLPDISGAIMVGANNLSDLANIVTSRSNIGIQSGYILVTSGTSFTTPANITTNTKFKIYVIGGGGGGGGINTSNGSASGGGGGGVAVVWISGLSPSTSYTCAIGAGGSGGGAPGDGTNGGDTTLTIGATTYTGGGGAKGIGAISSAGGAGGVATNGTMNFTGQGGGDSPAASTASTDGKGGDSALGFGVGGAQVRGLINGNPGQGYGGGGSGGKSLSATGGAGSAGAIYAEYFN